MKRASVLGHFIVRHTFGVCMAGALLGAIYGFLIVVLQPISNATTSPDFHFDLGPFVTTLLIGCIAGLAVGVIGGVFGALLGIVAGFVNGLLLGPLTILAYYPPAEYKYYRLVTGLISAIAGLTTTYVLFFYGLPNILKNVSPRESQITLLTFLLSPAPIAGFGAWWANRFVARWYQHELPALEAEADSAARETADNAHEVPG